MLCRRVFTSRLAKDLRYYVLSSEVYSRAARRGFCSQLQARKTEHSWPSNVKSHDWNRAIADGERIVGYPTAYFSLKFLLSDEFSSIAQHLRKLLGTNHPILRTAKRLVYHGRTNMQTRGLVVLLLSKAAGHTSSCTDIDESTEYGITPRQQSLAEITEMIHTAHLIHKGILNLSASSAADDEVMQDLQFGNKISILSGDYLLANACQGLANLRNCKVVDLISKAIADFMQSEFLGEHDKDGIAVPFKDMDFAFWEQKNYLSAGSLLANSCKATLELAGHSELMQEKGFEFGKNLGLSWQVYSDLQPFVDSFGHPPGVPFDLTSLPVILHLQSNPSLSEAIQHKIGDRVDNFDFKSLHEAIAEGDAVSQTKDLLTHYSGKAEEILSEFGPTPAAKALSNIINSLKD